MSLAERLKRIESEIAGACKSAGRARNTVRMVAASKGQPANAIRHAVAAGHRLFGENYAQEMRDKRSELAGSMFDLEWHFIGRVQTSNAKEIASSSLVHGVGSADQARVLARRGPVSILLQLSLWEEETKNGFSLQEIERDLDVVRGLADLDVLGFMAMPPPTVEPRAAFAKVREVRDRIAPDLKELSMGMSADFPAAILEGATLVRIGTALFGPRPPKEPE